MLLSAHLRCLFICRLSVFILVYGDKRRLLSSSTGDPWPLDEAGKVRPHSCCAFWSWVRYVGWAKRAAVRWREKVCVSLALNLRANSKCEWLVLGWLSESFTIASPLQAWENKAHSYFLSIHVTSEHLLENYAQEKFREYLDSIKQQKLSQQTEQM